MVNKMLTPAAQGKSLVALVLLWCLATSASAVIETYEFDNDELRQRYHYFTDVLRCPKCQNQNLSGSNSPIAEDLRRELHRLLQEGYSDADIREYMVSRYGEFILYEPPLNRHTVVLWFFPVVLLGIGALILVLVVRRRAVPPVAQLDDALLQQRAAQLRERNRAAQRDSSLPDQEESR
jgi:cytochrome c-type biogenesis protein CcmH